MATLKQLLDSLIDVPINKNRFLPNTKATWDRINKKDAFLELGFSSADEKTEFFREWIQENPYSNIK